MSIYCSSKDQVNENKANIVLAIVKIKLVRLTEIWQNPEQFQQQLKHWSKCAYKVKHFRTVDIFNDNENIDYSFHFFSTVVDNYRSLNSNSYKYL